MHYKLMVAAALLSGLCAPSALALEPWAVYDDFSAEVIDESRWNWLRRPDADVIEFAREITGGNLRLYNRSFSDFVAPGLNNETAVRLRLQEKEAVTQVAAQIVISEAAVQGCTNPNRDSLMYGRLSGHFFKDGPANPTDATNDVFAALGLVVRPGDVEATVRALIFLCGDRDCNSGAGSLLYTNETDLGTVSFGTPVLLGLIWDPDRDRFIFRRDGQFLPYSYAGQLDDTTPPADGLDFVGKRIEVRGWIENCASGPRAEGAMDLRIGRVLTNAAAVTR